MRTYRLLREHVVPVSLCDRENRRSPSRRLQDRLKKTAVVTPLSALEDWGSFSGDSDSLMGGAWIYNFTFLFYFLLP